MPEESIPVILSQKYTSPINEIDKNVKFSEKNYSSCALTTALVGFTNLD
jgi:hypothetical protein